MLKFQFNYTISISDFEEFLFLFLFWLMSSINGIYQTLFLEDEM